MNDAHIADLKAQYAAYKTKHPKRAEQCANELARYGVDVNQKKGDS